MKTLLAALVLLPGLVFAQGRALTIDDLYDPAKRIDFSGGAPSGLAWMSDTEYAWPKPGERGSVEWLKVDAATGTSTPLFDAAKMRAAFDALPGLSAEGVARLPNSRGLVMNPARTAAVASIGDDLYYYAFGTDRAFRLTFDPAVEEEFWFSPDGQLLAFLRANDIYVIEVDQRRIERRLTTDGGPQLLNGKLDWVYQEEIYGRGNYRAYWWSPDSLHLAYLQLNETPVPEFTVIDHLPKRLGIETWDYPKAGDPNPTVKLGVLSVAGGATRWANLEKYAPSEFLIVNVSWAPDGKQVAYQVQNREQTWLDLNLIDPNRGEPRTVLRETTKAWVDPIGPPTFLKDGTFLWASDRSGWRHVYQYKMDGSLVRAVTSGAWDVKAVHGVDEAGGWLYCSGTERSYIGSDVYRVKVDGTGLTRLTQAPGSHRATFSPGLAQYIDTFSDLNTPPQVRVHRADGAQVRLVHESKVDLSPFKLSKPELLQVKARDGFAMEAILIKPVDFNPSRKYPVMQFTYAGPAAPMVRNAWFGSMMMYYQMLAQRGIAVWIMDNRSASAKGAQSAWVVHKQLGVSELADIEDGLTWLKKQSWVDGSRVGIDGWSYGGFMTTYALTHSTSFAMGIGGGNVTDWGLYDSIYTERMMLMPQNNPEGYEKASVLKAAKNLHGQLLLIHGMIDDNVHLQNTMALAYELQKAGKPFRLMTYERSRHGVADPDLVKHMRQMMLDFTVETLLKPVPQTATTASK